VQSGRDTKHGLAEINVTPLVDIMLVLLIIFMVSAPMMQQGVPLTLPKADASPVPIEENQLVVSVTADKKIYINDQPVALKDLSGKLEALRKENPRRKVFLRADENVPYGIVVRAMAAVERAGIHDLGMLTEPEKL
jgi:biopolymer transport protein TolR